MTITVTYVSGTTKTAVSIDAITDKQNVIALDCLSCRLTTLAGIEHLTNLHILQCYGNQLTTLAGIEHLTNLQKLYCGSNQLTTLAGIEHLTNLHILYCDRNQLTTLPACLINFTRLRSFDYDNNPLEYVPAVVNRFIQQLRNGQHTNLQVYGDGQNVHNSAITQSVKDSIMMLLNTVKPLKYEDIMSII